MADGDALMQALGATQISPAQTGYGQLQQGIGVISPALISPYGNVGTNLGIAAGSALLQGLLASQAQRQSVAETIEASRLALQMQSQPAQDRLNLIEGLNNQRLQSRLLEVNLAMQQREAATRAAIDQKRLETRELLMSPERKMQLAEEEAQARRQAALEVEKTIAARKGIPLDMVSKMDYTRPTLAEALPTEGRYGQYSPLEARKKAKIRSYVQEEGMTPNEAATQAERDLSVERQANKSALQRVEESRRRSGALESISSKAATAIEGAGETGGPAFVQQARDLASGLYQYLPTPGGLKEKQQRAAEAQLQSIGPEVTAMAKSPGAISDYEQRLYVGSGPSADKTPEQNAAIIQNMRLFSSLETDYANFLENYIQDAGTSVGADRLWGEYKKNEVFKDGKVNYGARPFEEWFASQKQEGAVAAPTGMAAGQEARLEKFRAALRDPSVSESTKAAIRAKFDELGIR